MKKLLLVFMLLCTLLSCSKKSKTSTIANSQLPPFKIVVLEDFSGSTKRENKVDMQTLFYLADSVAHYGGVLAYGTIINNSDIPLIELYIAEPPQPTTAQMEKNPFKKESKAKQVANSEAAKDAAKIRQIDCDNKIATFLNLVEKRRKKTKTAQFSDVSGALERAEQIVCAPNSFSRAPRTLVVVCSDLQHDFIGGNRERWTGFSCPLYKPMLVVGAQNSGNLNIKQSDFANFTSFDEAIRYIFINK